MEKGKYLERKSVVRKEERKQNIAHTVNIKSLHILVQIGDFCDAKKMKLK